MGCRIIQIVQYEKFDILVSDMLYIPMCMNCIVISFKSLYYYRESVLVQQENKNSQSTKIFNNIKLTKKHIFSIITNAQKYLYKTE